jgi:hypothetical protein
MKKPFQGDWAFLSAAAADLKSYLLSPQLYWPVSVAVSVGAGDISRLSLGNVLLILRRVQAVEWDDERKKELDAIEKNIDAVHQQWRSNWQQKAAKEYSARLKLWAGYLNELFDDRRRAGTGYSSSVRWRAILHLLQPDMPGTNGPEVELLNALDRRLRLITDSGTFVWEPELQPGFPQDEFWYLYVTIKNQAV